MNSIGNFIEKRRSELNLSQNKIAKILGFSTGQYISNIERGLCDLSPHYFKSMAKLLEVSPSDFIKLAVNDYEERLWKIVSKRGK